jgi:hypothetical protein
VRNPGEVEPVREEERDAPSVRTVAVSVGILHMGRYAAAYHEAFGEAPSDTLHRPS